MSIPSQDTWACDDDGHGGENDSTNKRTRSKFRSQLDHQPRSAVGDHKLDHGNRKETKGASSPVKYQSYHKPLSSLDLSQLTASQSLSQSLTTTPPHNCPPPPKACTQQQQYHHTPGQGTARSHHELFFSTHAKIVLINDD